MLLPFEWSVLTVQEAKLLMEYIEKSTSSKTMPKRYDKMQQVGMLEIYTKLRDFVESHAQYQALQGLDTGSLMTLTE